jgi:hypothetical protein
VLLTSFVTIRVLSLSPGREPGDPSCGTKDADPP